MGHKRDLPAEPVVTTAKATVAPPTPAVKPAPPAKPPKVDFAFLREQVTMEQVLHHLGWLTCLKRSRSQLRGPCPIHGQIHDRRRSFSVALDKHVFRCFHGECSAQGNVLDLWAAVHKLSLHEAAVHLAETFRLALPIREEEPVSLPRQPSS